MTVNYRTHTRRWRAGGVGAALLAALALITAACGGGGGASSAGGAQSAPGAPAGRLRLGYFANVTHAPAVIGEENGLFEAHLGDGVEVDYEYFNAGTEAVEALFSGAIDATFIGSGPAINAYAQSGGEALRIVAGTTSGGAALVVRDGIDDPRDLKGATLATPALGNTQDVALRAWLEAEGFETTAAGGGDVSIRPQANADTLASFTTGTIDGAWVPEPWATRLVQEGGGHVLVDERDLWPGGRFVTTHLVVATDYLRRNPAVVRALVEGLLEAIDAANGDAEAAQKATNAGIERITTKALAEETIRGSWSKLTFTPDPVASSLEKAKDDAVAAGLLEEVDLDGIYDLRILNAVLAERGRPEVRGL